MIIDGRSVPSGETVDADVCIVGAGPAGLTVARQLAGSDLRVCVLESGGIQREPEAQDLADGTNSGYPYFSLREARARVFGGSSDLWDEFLRGRPLDPVDFERRDAVPFSGWPISRSDLDPYYEQAQQLLGFGPFEYDAEPWERVNSQASLTRGMKRVHSSVFQYSNAFDFTRHRRELDHAANVVVMLHTIGTELVPSEAGESVAFLAAATIRGPKFRVRSRRYVLAAGGIDNPRLLLLSRNQDSRGIGNRHDLVGRFFMEHLHVRSAVLLPDDDDLMDNVGFYQEHDVDGVRVRGTIAVNEDVLRDEGLLNTTFLLFPSDMLRSSDLYRSMAVIKESWHKRSLPTESLLGHATNILRRLMPSARLVYGLARNRLPDTRRVLWLVATAEQAPNPDSRVLLGEGRDSLGMSKPVLDWRLSDIDRRSIRRAEEIIDEELRGLGRGRLTRLFGDERPARVLRGHWHHMGTTRMSRDPTTGVVDETCRVHSTDNVYVAGSSVFPTGGNANPTLTIVALSIRLAEHLESGLHGQSGLGPIW